MEEGLRPTFEPASRIGKPNDGCAATFGEDAAIVGEKVLRRRCGTRKARELSRRSPIGTDTHGRLCQI
jgi:hypothetical protein